MRFAAIFVLLAKRLESRDLLKWIVLGIAAQVWLQSLMSTAQYATGSSLGLEFLGERQGVKTFFTEEGAEPRAGGLMGHPNNLALFLVLVIPLLLAKTLTARSLLPRLGWGATFLVANEALLLSFSRFGWICSVLGFFAVYAMVNARERKPLWLGLGLPLFASLAVFVVLFAGFENFRDRLLEDDRGSAESRIEQFKTAIEILWHWPITGTGIGSYTSGAFRFVESQGPTSPALFMRVHNGSLLIAAELGLLGLIGYHAWYFQVLRRGWRSWRSADDEIFAVSIGVFVGLCAWFLKSMYNAHTPIMDPAVWLFAALMIATARFAKRDADATAGRQ
jgi:O-antigen ligase